MLSVGANVLLMHTHSARTFRVSILSLFALSAGLTACSTTADKPADKSTSSESSSAVAQPTEVRGEQTRLAISTDGGVMVVDATDAEKGTAPKLLKEFDAKGYLRLNPSGDGRHVIVSTEDAFKPLDLGAFAVAHGDHSHYYAGDATWSELTVKAKAPGHVVGTPENTVLFDDETGQVTEVELKDLVAGNPENAIKDQFNIPPHHGIALKLADGKYLTTKPEGEKAAGLMEVDKSGKELKDFMECPGTHGVGEAADGVVLAGCTDGVLIYRDGEVKKLKAKDSYGRTASEAASMNSQYVIGDYKVEENNKEEKPTRIVAVDTKAGVTKLVDLGTSYSFRSLKMTDTGTGVVLGTDGKIHLIDAAAGTVSKSIPVIDKWEVPADWQETRPSIALKGDVAYVTNPADNTLHVVDLKAGKVTAKANLPKKPDEITTAG